MSDWVVSFEDANGRTHIEHLDGVDWIDAPIPPRFHRCKAQTRGWTSWFVYIERCACGASKPGGSRIWVGKNERRKSKKWRRGS